MVGFGRDSTVVAGLFGGGGRRGNLTIAVGAGTRDNALKCGCSCRHDAIPGAVVDSCGCVPSARSVSRRVCESPRWGLLFPGAGWLVVVLLVAPRGERWWSDVDRTGRMRLKFKTGWLVE